MQDSGVRERLCSRWRFAVALLVVVGTMLGTAITNARPLPPPTGIPTCYADAVAVGMIEVKWTDIENETQYRVERLSPTGWIEVTATGGGSGNPMGGHYLDTNVAPQTTYTYRVRGWNSAGFSPYSNQAAATSWAEPATTAPNAPRLDYVEATVLSRELSGVGMTLYWEQAAGATGYRIESKALATGTWTEIANVPAQAPFNYSETFTQTNLTTDTDYYYRLRAYNDAGLSPYSNELMAHSAKPPTPPPTLQGSAVSYNELELRWNNVLPCDCQSPGWIGYRLEIPDGAGWTNLAYLGDNVTNYIIRGLQPATDYSYRLRSENPLASEWSYVTVRTQDAPATVPQAPVLYDETESGRSIRVKWLDVELETEYRIEKKNSAGQWEQIATVPANTVYYIDAGLEPLTTYTYRVRAANSYGVSAYSNESAGTTGAPPEIPRIDARAWNSGQIQVLYYAAEGAVLYRLERDSGAGWESIHESTTVPVYPEYIDSGLTDFHFYKYRVGAKNAAGTWFYSAEVAARPHMWEMQQAQLSAKAISTSAIELSWEAVPFAQAYYIVKLVNGVWQVRTQVWYEKIYVDTGLLPNTTYTYLVYGHRSAEPETAATTATTLATENPGITVHSLSLVDDNLTFRIVGIAGQTFKIQSSPNFTAWSDVTQTLTLTADMQVNIPRPPPTQNMFYRTLSTQ